MTLCVRIALVPGTHALDSVQDRRILKGRLAKVGPIAPLPPGDDIVDRGEGQPAVVEVAVAHASATDMAPGRQIRLN